MKKSTTLVIILILVIALLSLTACQLQPATTDIYVGGDSITYQADVNQLSSSPTGGTLLQDQLDGPYNELAWAVVPGATTYLLNELPSEGSGVGKVFVMNLGTNDVGVPWGEDEPQVPLAVTAWNIRTNLERINPNCVVFTTVNETPSLRINETAPILNEWLRTSAGDGYEVVINEWADAHVEHPEFYVGDGIHMTAEGRQAFRASVTDSVAACLERTG